MVRVQRQRGSPQKYEVSPEFWQSSRLQNLGLVEANGVSNLGYEALVFRYLQNDREPRGSEFARRR